MTDFGAEELSDDEDVFFGEMTLKEVKKHIWLSRVEVSNEDVYFQKMTLEDVKKQLRLNFGKKRNSHITDQEATDYNSSVPIIESHSQPNLQSTSENEAGPSLMPQNQRNSDESFVRMENLISNMCISPEKSTDLEFNNTLEMVNFILNNGPDQDIIKPVSESTINSKKIDSPNSQQNMDIAKEIEITETLSCCPKVNSNIDSESADPLSMFPNCSNIKQEVEPKINSSPLPNLNLKKDFMSPSTSRLEMKLKTILKDTTPAKSPKKHIAKIEQGEASPKYFTPAKSPRKQDEFHTPSMNLIKPNTHNFKTPANPLSAKKPSASSLRSTPSKSLMYKHIESPIASYIKAPLKIPMINKVCPKKPLLGTSMIPKLVKTTPKIKPHNKENVNMPTSVYKSAKKTRVVCMPDENKLQSPSAKKLLSKLPSLPVVIKHEARQFNSERKPLFNLQEDSIADLSCAQAEVSLCTQIKPTKK